MKQTIIHSLAVLLLSVLSTHGMEKQTAREESSKKLNNPQTGYKGELNKDEGILHVENTPSIEQYQKVYHGMKLAGKTNQEIVKSIDESLEGGRQIIDALKANKIHKPEEKRKKTDRIIAALERDYKNTEMARDAFIKEYPHRRPGITEPVSKMRVPVLETSDDRASKGLFSFIYETARNYTYGPNSLNQSSDFVNPRKGSVSPSESSEKYASSSYSSGSSSASNEDENDQPFIYSEDVLHRTTEASILSNVYVQNRIDIEQSQNELLSSSTDLMSVKKAIEELDTMNECIEKITVATAKKSLFIKPSVENTPYAKEAIESQKQLLEIAYNEGKTERFSSDL